MKVTHVWSHFLQVLNHDLVTFMGLKIWGAGWAPHRGDSFSGNNYDDIPAGGLRKNPSQLAF